MDNENELINIIDDQAHAMQKLCEILRNERTKKHIVMENVKITGDRFVIDGNADFFGDNEFDLKHPLEIKRNLNFNNSSIMRFADKIKKIKKVKKCKKKKR